METQKYTQRERLVVDLSDTGMDYSAIAERLRMTSEDVRRIAAIIGTVNGTTEATLLADNNL